MNVKKVKLHFEAIIHEDDGSMEMSIEWESNIEYAVAVLCTAAEKHPQIYEAIVASAKALKREVPKDISTRMAELLMSTLEDLDPSEVSEEDQELLTSRLMAMKAMKPQGDA